MKNLILTIVLTVLTSLSFAQKGYIDLGKLKEIGSRKVLNEKVIEINQSDDSTFYFTFKDYKYQTLINYESFVFNSSDSLYYHIMNCLKTGNSYYFTDSKGNTVNIYYGKSMGKGYVEIYYNIYKSIWCNEKHIKQLFGKL